DVPRCRHGSERPSRVRLPQRSSLCAPAPVIVEPMDTLNTTTPPDPDLRSETTAARRATLAEKVWVEDGRWIDPPFEADGRAAIVETIGGVQEQFPGHSFRQISGVDMHHDLFRFAWELAGPDGSVTVTGIDVGQLADDGRFRRITGFLGDLPALAA